MAMVKDMTESPTLGLMVPPSVPPELVPKIAMASEAAGLDCLWVCEDCFAATAITYAALALSATEKIRVGTGFLSAPVRNVATAAMDFSILARNFPGRVVPGIGHGWQPHMAQVGAKVDSPLALLEEYVIALRDLLNGNTVNTSGRYVRLDDVRLAWPPDPLPIMVGADGPKSLRLAGRIGDGTILTSFVPKDEITSRRELINPVPGHRILLARTIAVGAGSLERLQTDPGHYPELGLVKSPSLAVGGSAAEVADQLLDMRDLGVTDFIASPTGNEPDLVEYIRALGQEVKPLLRA